MNIHWKFQINHFWNLWVRLQTYWPSLMFLTFQGKLWDFQQLEERCLVSLRKLSLPVACSTKPQCHELYKNLSDSKSVLSLELEILEMWVVDTVKGLAIQIRKCVSRVKNRKEKIRANNGFKKGKPRKKLRSCVSCDKCPLWQCFILYQSTQP